MYYRGIPPVMTRVFPGLGARQLLHPEGRPRFRRQLRLRDPHPLHLPILRVEEAVQWWGIKWQSLQIGFAAHSSQAFL